MSYEPKVMGAWGYVVLTAGVGGGVLLAMYLLGLVELW